LIQNDHCLTIQAQGFTDTVIWNPGAEKAPRWLTCTPPAIWNLFALNQPALGSPCFSSREQPGRLCKN